MKSIIWGSGIIFLFVAALLLNSAPLWMLLAATQLYIYAQKLGEISRLKERLAKLVSMSRFERAPILGLVRGSLDSLLSVVEYRLTSMSWQLQTTTSATANHGALTEIARDSDLAGLRKLLTNGSEMFRSKNVSFIEQQGEALLPLIMLGEEGVSYRVQIEFFARRILLAGGIHELGLVDHSIGETVLGAFARFGVRYTLSEIVEWSDADGKHRGVLILGYAIETVPSEIEIRRIKTLALDLGNFLTHDRRVRGLRSELVAASDLSQAKGEFIAHMSHDIRTPLNNVRSILTLLKLEKTLPDQDEMVEVAIRNCESLGGLLDDVMDYSKHQAGKLVAAPVAFDLGKLVNRVIAEFQYLARKKGVLLISESRSGDFTAIADPRQIRRIVTNVVSNALKYTEEGIVKIVVRAVSSGQVAVYVKDTGIGMSEVEMSRLFQPFTRHREFEVDGVGLGLALSKALLELNNGSFSVKSSLGDGTEFGIVLPGHQGVAAELKPEARSLVA